MHQLIETWFRWVLEWGYLGIVVLMAMESSIFPVPSEVVIPPAAFLAAQGHLTFRVYHRGTVGYISVQPYLLVSRVLAALSCATQIFPGPSWKLEQAEAWLARYEGWGFLRQPPSVLRHLISILPELSG